MNTIRRLTGPIRALRATLGELADGRRYRQLTQGDVLFAFYDLAVAPPTFDILKFVVLSEIARKESGCCSIHVVIVPNDEPASGTQGTAASAADRWRLRNLLFPCCWLMPTCMGVSVCTSREEAQVIKASRARNVFPRGYKVRFPRENAGLKYKGVTVSHFHWNYLAAAVSGGLTLPTLRTTTLACEMVREFTERIARGRRVITITLRECSYSEDRNSNLKEWGRFARDLPDDDYLPLIVRDFETALKPLPAELTDLTVFPEPVWNIELRAALYEVSYLNMLVGNGPMELCFLNKRARCLVFKMVTPSCSETTVESFRSQGVEPGDQFPWAGPFQRVIWSDDRFEVLQEAFQEMCSKIESCLVGEGGA